MVRSPSRNDRLLAETLGARPSTVTAVRARLEESGIVRRIYVPSLPALGAGVLSVAAGGLPPGASGDLKKARRSGRFPTAGCDSFLAVADASGWLELGAYRDYSQADRCGGGLLRATGGAHPGGAAPPGMLGVYPVELVRFHNFFDFWPFLDRRSGIGETAARPPPFPAAPARRLPKVERLALYGLVKAPAATDAQVALELGVSRQSVARARTRLVAEGTLRQAVVLDLRRLGAEVLALFRFRFHKRRQEATGGVVEALLEKLPHIFAVSAGAECLVLAAFRDRSALAEAAAALAPQPGPAGPFDGPPEIHQCTLADAIFARDLDFVPFVKSALGLDIAE